MSLGLVGRKVGMTRIFAEDGASVPVTVLDVSNNRVAQIKTPETDGYAAVQVAFGQRRATRMTKALSGHLAKAGVESSRVLKEFPIAADQLDGFKPGDAIAATIFEAGQKSTSPASPLVRAFRVVSSVTTSARNVPRTVTRCRITHRVRSVWRRIRVAFSRVSAWLVTSVMFSVRLRTWLWFVSTPIVSFSSSRVPFPALAVRTSSCVPPSRPKGITWN